MGPLFLMFQKELFGFWTCIDKECKFFQVFFGKFLTISGKGFKIGINQKSNQGVIFRELVVIGNK